MSKTMKIAVACFIGAFLGAMISLELAARFEFGQYLWIIGTAVGAVVGYIGYDPKHFFYSIPKAVISTAKEVNFKDMVLLPIGKVLTIVLVVVVMLVLIGLLVMLWTSSGLSYAVFLNYAKHAFGTGGIFDVAVIITAMLGMGCAMHMHNKDESAGWWDFFSIFWMPIKVSAPVVPFYMIYLLVKHAKTIWRAVVATMKFVGLSCKKLFIAVHSDRRLLCLVDSAIGATIGYFVGNAIIGAVAGMVIGLVNYQIVSIWILKLVPDTAEK
ncbi:MAG: hypothetical protein WC310_02660 [Patescibacteria group bacterium]|jgi:hypothetical protein